MNTKRRTISSTTRTLKSTKELSPSMIEDPPAATQTWKAKSEAIWALKRRQNACRKLFKSEKNTIMPWSTAFSLPRQADPTTPILGTVTRSQSRLRFARADLRLSKTLSQTAQTTYFNPASTRPCKRLQISSEKLKSCKECLITSAQPSPRKTTTRLPLHLPQSLRDLTKQLWNSLCIRSNLLDTTSQLRKLW